MLKQNKMKNIIYGVFIIGLTLPSLLITLYSYPNQDDFHYAFWAKKLMDEGNNIFVMAWKMTLQYYKTFAGCYTSTFLGHFFSGIIQCNIWGIRLYELASLIIFYISLYLCITSILKEIFKTDKEVIMPTYALFLACFNCLIYYAEHEDFYWFITSVQYLTICSMIHIGVFLYIKAIASKNMFLLAFASIFGFLGSGGALNIAAYCCILYLLATAWGIFVQREYKFCLIGMLIPLFGAIMNGIAPGNYVRKGENVSVSEILEAMQFSVKYAFERIWMLVNNPVFICIVALLLGIILINMQSKKYRYEFYMPLTFSFVLFCMVAIVIFPVMLGYSLDTYKIICRSNFISDMAIYLFVFIDVFYWAGWLGKRLDNCHIQDKLPLIFKGLIVIIIVICFIKTEWSSVPFMRQVNELISGECKRYSEYCIGLYKKAEESEGDIVTIYISEVPDTTCMINPQIRIGYYDYEKEHANYSIARFYGKTAIYYITDECETERDMGE